MATNLPVVDVWLGGGVGGGEERGKGTLNPTMTQFGAGAAM